MKKTFALFFTLGFLFPLGAFAQYQPGMVSLGGSADLTHQTYSGSSLTFLSITPTVAYSYSGNGEVGLGLSYDFSDPSSNGIGILPFFRYNDPLAEKFGVYGLVGPTFNMTFGDDDFHSWYVGVQASAGLFYFPVNRVSIELALGSMDYSYGKVRTNGSPTFTRKEWSGRLDGNSLGLTLYYHL